MRSISTKITEQAWSLLLSFNAIVREKSDAVIAGVTSALRFTSPFYKLGADEFKLQVSKRVGLKHQWRNFLLEHRKVAATVSLQTSSVPI